MKYNNLNKSNPDDTARHLLYKDALGESLGKIHALICLFDCNGTKTYNEEMVQWYFMAMLEHIRNAIGAWEQLQENAVV